MRLHTLNSDANPALPASTLAACQQRISELWGLHFPPERWRDLSRHLRLVAGELDISLPAMGDALLREPPSPRVAAHCVREFTVGETYFLRDADFFTKLRQAVLTPLIARRRAAQDLHLRFWSAGCCTGEEAYTLAILLGELLPDLERWQVQIIASDLNPAFLASARRGSYGNWSFRQVSGAWRQRHFDRESNNRWHIHDAYRERVTFLEHNLIEACYPDTARGLAQCDVILCRNVLMYFSPKQATSTLRRMLTCLEPGGVLLLASQEGMLCHWAELTPELWPGALCLRRQALDERDTHVSRHAAAPAPVPVSVPQQTLESTLSSQSLSSPVLSNPVHPTAKQQAHTAATTARTCANQHQLQEALEWAEHALELDKLEPGLYWLLASLQIEQGAHQQARATLRKAIYLQPDFVMAHYLCGLLDDRLGDPAAAVRDWKNCLKLLENLPDDYLLQEAEGLSVRDLKKLTRNALEKVVNETSSQ